MQNAMLSRLNAERDEFLVQAFDHVAFAIEIETGVMKPKRGGEGDRAVSSGRVVGGHYFVGGRNDQGECRRRYVTRVKIPDSLI